jgi:hypothetical protein
MKSLSSLPPTLLAAYYRNQSDPVKQNIRKGLGIFFSTEGASSNTLTISNKKKSYEQDKMLDL